MLGQLLDEIRRQSAGGPPVGSWHPTVTRPFDMRIDRAGRWFHEGTEITRAPLIRLLASVLCRNPEGYWLVTPTERFPVHVEDAPFIAYLEAIQDPGEGQVVFLRTHLGDLFTLDEQHSLQWRGVTGQEAPYVAFRHGTEARLSTSAWYGLAERVVQQGSDWGLWSQGQFMPVPVQA